MPRTLHLTLPLRNLLALAFCVAATLLAMFAVAGTASTKGARLSNSTPGWAIVGSPNDNHLTDNNLAKITCVTQSDCWAVGSYKNEADRHQTLIEHWNGDVWKVVASPNINVFVNAFEDNYLTSVTCTSASDCWAVGYHNNRTTDQTLIERWDGSSWTIVTSANASTSRDNALEGINCVSASQCWAVGYAVSSGNRPQTLIEQWNGTSWSIVASPNNSGRNHFLRDVACTSASQCWAVGTFLTSSNYLQTLIEQWNGSAWTIVASANTSSEEDNNLSGITCPSASQCWAVGYSLYFDSETFYTTYQTLIERWDGVSWTRAISPKMTGQYHSLSDVTCISTTDCWAVGGQSIERWDGVSWTIFESSDTDSLVGGLASVACVQSECWAVGDHGVYAGQNSFVAQTLIRHWDGSSWETAPSANALIMLSNSLDNVTCLSASNCWAVGHAGPVDNNPEALIEHWNGTSWEIVAADDEMNKGAFYGVTCLTADECWAVGNYNDPFNLKTLIEHWDGTSWSVILSPSSSTKPDNFLKSVACTSISDCWTVGYFLDLAPFQDQTAQTLIEHWDGKSWTIVPSPNTDESRDNQLSSITCVSVSDCWAVGYYSDGLTRTLVQHWNGATWSIVSSPNRNLYSRLYAVTCPAAGECWAVGEYADPNGILQTLIERWDGNAWTVVPSPNPSATKHNHLYGVTCTSTSRCWAVGAVGNSQFQTPVDVKTIVEVWDGSQWTIAPSPNRANISFLSSIACASPQECWSVGNYNIASGSTMQTLVEKYSPTIPPLISVASRVSHGSAGVFDINLPLTDAPGTECRNTNGNYSVVFSFANEVSDCGSATPFNASVTKGPNRNQCTESLTNVGNPQALQAGLNNVVDAQSNVGSVDLPFNVLLGDTNGDGSVNSADIGQTKSQSGAPLTNANFREDVNADGSLNSGDVGLVKSKSGTALP